MWQSAPPGSRWFSRAVFPGGDVEDSLICDYLGPGVGTFVDVGANDPIAGSKTWRLEQAGWDGLLVEPLSEHVQRLRQLRRAKVADVACAGPEHDGGSLTLRVAGLGGSESSLGAFIRPQVVERETRTVRVRTLDSLVEEFAIERVDFLSIDVEGFEMEVLSGFSLQQFRPKLVLLEDHVFDHRLHRYMQSHCYRLVRRTSGNAWYVPSDSDLQVSVLGRLQLFKKYYVGLPIRLLKRRRAASQAAAKRSKGSP